MKINICEFKGEIAKRGKKNPSELLLFYAIQSHMLHLLLACVLARTV